jgi:hypothetical protein
MDAFFQYRWSGGSFDFFNLLPVLAGPADPGPPAPAEPVS